MRESEEAIAMAPAKRSCKSEVIHVRVSSGERAALDAAASLRGEKLSTFLRVAALWQAGAPGQVDVETTEMRLAVKALTGATNNLNQLAKAANRGRISMSEADRLMLLELRDAIRQSRGALDSYTKAAASRAGRLPVTKSALRVGESEPVS